MRNIDANVLNLMRAEYGLESVLIVRVFWNNTTYIDYADKEIEEYQVQGKILELSNLNDIIGIDEGGSEVQVQVTLDDSDGSIKDIIGTIDTHKKKVQVLQWFTNLPFGQAFVLFNGLMNTPMEWSEGERTFKFTALNLVENLEVGFALDEGKFQGLPVAIAGKAFPMVFGRALLVPSLIVGAPPSGLLARGLGIIYNQTFQDLEDKLNLDLAKAIRLGRAQYQIASTAQGIASSYRNSGGGATGGSQLGLDPQSQFNIMVTNSNADPEALPPAVRYDQPDQDYQTANQFDSTASSYLDRANQYMVESKNLEQRILDLKQEKQGLEQLGNIPGVTILSSSGNEGSPSGNIFIAALNYNFSPLQQRPYLIEMNGTYFNVNEPDEPAGTINLKGETAPPNLRPYDPYFGLYKDSTISRNTQSTKTAVKFKWFDAGTRIRFLDVPVYYIACYGANSQITGVWARAKGVRVPVPSSYYTIGRWSFTNSDLNTVSAQLVTMSIPLTSILDKDGQNIYDSDEIWCDINGEVGNNFADIIAYVATVFSDLTLNGPEALAVKSLTFNNPMNFVLFERKPILDFMRELAFQAKVAIWLNDREIRMRYLSAEYPPVDTITPADLIEDSLVITSTSTEELVTKMVGTWKSNFDQETHNITTLRYNMAKYGLHSEDVDYYGFNMGSLVQRSLAFWVVRKGTIWKRIRFKCFIDKLNIESHDPVKFSGFEAFFSCKDVVGTIEQAVYDSASNTIEMEAWLPIKWGDMCQTPYAYPSDQVTVFGDPNNPDFLTGNPYQGAADPGNVIGQSLQQTFKNSHPQPPLDRTTDFNMQDTNPGLSPETAIAYTPINPIRPDGIESANVKDTYDLKVLPALVSADDGAGNADIGTVMSKSDEGQVYQVRLQNRSTVVEATQQQIADGFKVVNGSVVYLIRKNGKWMMQFPVWAKEAEENV